MALFCPSAMKRLLNIGLITLGLLSYYSNSSLYAQDSKNELRGVWVTTLLNIDWPSQSARSTIQQKQEVAELLDLHQSQGINAIFLQVRPAADAFYKSSLEPWSLWLTGIQGEEPKPYYDPLKFWIEECHKRGMELHAWFNPFRAAVNDDVSLLHSSHIIKRQPDWFINYAGRIYFDPGQPQVRHYLVKVIAEVASNYKVDGIHFDDYFYPYKVNGEAFNDKVTFEKYRTGTGGLESWRRQNIDDFIQKASDTLRKIDGNLRFGVSPFGVWRNLDQDPQGSATHAGHTNYDDLYADVVKWMKEGWIDYLAPQLYWHIGYELADYQTLLDWWAKHSYGRHIYIGQSAYKVQKDADFTQWRKASELSEHLRLNRQYPQVQGNIYFSSNSLRANTLGLSDTLKRYHYGHHAIVPPMDYKPTSRPQTPDVYRISHGHKELTIYWAANKEVEDSRYLLIYRFNGSSSMGTTDPSKIIARIPAGETNFKDTPPKKGYYTYVITTVSKSNHESRSSLALTINYRKRQPRKKRVKI